MGGEKGRRGHISEADVTGEAWVGLELAQWDPRWVLSASEWDRGSSSKAALDCWGRALGPAAVHPPLCSPAAGPPRVQAPAQLLGRPSDSGLTAQHALRGERPTRFPLRAAHVRVYVYMRVCALECAPCMCTHSDVHVRVCMRVYMRDVQLCVHM